MTVTVSNLINLLNGNPGSFGRIWIANPFALATPPVPGTNHLSAHDPGMIGSAIDTGYQNGLPRSDPDNFFPGFPGYFISVVC